MESGAPTNRSDRSINVRVDYRMVVGALMLVIIVMLLLWRPWEPRFDADARTVTVTGETTLKAAPDEYTFNPMYEFQNADRNMALDELSKKSDEIVGKLKELGVADASIKTNTDGYSYPIYEKDGTVPSYSLRLTVSVNDKEIANKVQDYLVGTTPAGSVSPQYGFSEAKRKELEDKARDDATKDARSKADQSAKNLGFTVGKVKSVTDGTTFGGGYPAFRGDIGIAEDTATSNSLGLQPGENELTYQVNVVYLIK